MIEETKQPQEGPMQLEATDVEIDIDGFASHHGRPVTGEVVDRYDDGSIMSVTIYEDGFEEGTALEWYQGGALRVEENFSKGVPVGLTRKWHKNGQLAEEREFDGEGLLVRMRAWDEQGQPLRSD